MPSLPVPAPKFGLARLIPARTAAVIRLCISVKTLALLALVTSAVIPSELTRTVSAAEGVAITRANDDTLSITINGQPFATYHYGKAYPKPFMLPVRTESGTVITRALNDPADADHPHHKGLWVSVDEINQQQHWAEKAPIVNTDIQIIGGQSGSAVLTVKNEWRNAASTQAEVIETTRITIQPNRLLIYDITFTTTQPEAVFEDTKEGLLGFRVAPSMKEKNGGQIVSSDGTEGSKACWGKAFAWIDYVGQVDQKTAGVTLMDHPDNPRVSRYHVRDYGLFSISPFGQKAYTNGAEDAQPLHLKAGESFQLRYGVYVHDDDTAKANVADVYSQFLSVAR